MSYDVDHYNTGDGYPQCRDDVRFLSGDDLLDFMGECDAEPADFANCLACYAYGVQQGLGDDEMVKAQTERGRPAYRDSLSPYQLVLVERDRLAEEMVAKFHTTSTPERKFNAGILAGLDRALSVIADG